MINSKYIKSVIIAFICAITLTTSSICIEKVTAQPVNTPVQTVQGQTVKPLDVVNSPKMYLNRNLTMIAKFDKFSTLGLDYKPAFKSSEEYISFLIKRDDTTYDIPLSEMKLFLKRETAEKFIDLKTNDEVKIEGVLFSDALGDAWVDVKNLTVIKQAPDKNGVK